LTEKSNKIFGHYTLTPEGLLGVGEASPANSIIWRIYTQQVRNDEWGSRYITGISSGSYQTAGFDIDTLFKRPCHWCPRNDQVTRGKSPSRYYTRVNVRLWTRL